MSGQTLPNETINNIAREVTEAFRGIVSKDIDRKDAKEAFQVASNEAGSARENFLVVLSEKADQGHWSQYDIDNGIDRALAQRNDAKDNSIKTFAAEIKRACHPNARKHVRKLQELANSVWENETNQSKELPRPCRAAFSRKYHMLQRMIGEAVENKHVLETTQDVVTFALANDPSKDPTKVFKKFATLRDQLRALADEFPFDELIETSEMLREITLADFKHPDQRPEKSTGKGVERDESTSEGSDSGEENTASVSGAEDSGVVEPAKGISDLLDEALGDLGEIAA